MIVRRAVGRDAQAISGIWNDVIETSVATFTTELKIPDKLSRDIESHQSFWVAEDAGNILGFANSCQFRSGPGYQKTHELSIYLDRDARGNGVGRALLGALEACLKEKGVHVLIGCVAGENHAGLSFHKAMGFDEVGRLFEVGYKSGDFLDMVLMQKKL